MSEIIKSSLLHAMIAVAIQLAISPVVGLIGGAVAGVMYYVGREISQHEYKGGGPKSVKWYYGLLNHWNLDSSLDVLFPIIATGAVCVLLR